jgi:chromatin modification-related protein VID21
LTRKRKLRELQRVTVSCAASLKTGYQPKAEDLLYGDPDDNELRFLDQNDLTK